jgi:replicative DNA helicase
MIAPWWSDVTSEMPTPTELQQAADLISKRVAGWLAEKVEDDLPRVVTMREGLEEWLAEERRTDGAGIVTGWRDVDSAGRPVRRGEVILIAARTGVGKTWGVQAIIEHTLSQQDEARALVIELEMPAYQIAERVAIHALDTTPDEARKLAASPAFTVEEIVTARPLIDRITIVEQSVSVDTIDRLLSTLSPVPQIVAVDYLGLLRWDGNPNARIYDKASEWARALKDVAKKHRVVVLAAVQLSRDGGGDGDRKPGLSSLRDSGVLEEAADRVWGLWRPAPIEDETSVAKMGPGVQIAGVILKNRFGPAEGEFWLEYDKSMRLKDALSPAARDADAFPW